MKSPLLIYGAGGLGREVLALIRATEAWEGVGFIDDNIERQTIIHGLPVFGGASVLSEMHVRNLVIAIGDPRARKKIIQQLPQTAFHYPVLRHPRAIVQSDTVKIGEGSIITAGVVLTTDINIGKHVLINLNTTIGHDCRIGDYCAIMPGVNISGGVSLGECVLVGSGANILNGKTVGSNATIGMGAVVLKDVSPADTVAGVPAKSIR